MNERQVGTSWNKLTEQSEYDLRQQLVVVGGGFGKCFGTNPLEYPLYYFYFIIILLLFYYYIYYFIIIFIIILRFSDMVQ